MSFVDRPDGVRIHFIEHGAADDPTLVLVTGQGSAAGTAWRYQTEALAGRFRVVAVDNRGAGQTEWNGSPFTMSDLAGDVVAVLDFLNIERAAVLGISMGGIVAQEIALQQPDRLWALVLGCTQAGGAGDCVVQPDDEVLRGFVAALMATDLETQTELGAPYAFSARAIQETPGIVEEYFADRFAFPAGPEGVQAQAAAIAGVDNCHRLGDLRVTTLVLHGEDDVVCVPANADALASAIPGAEKALLPGGHLFLRESADQFNAAVIDFLTRHQPAG